MTKLKCTECGYENEAERVYCHNCGVKLDRSLLPKEAAKPEPKAVRKRVRKMTNPSSGFFVGFWRTLISTLIWAAILASLIQIARPPKDVPPMPELNIVDAPPIAGILEDAVQKGGGKSIVLDEPSINAFLFNAIRSKKGAGALKDYVRFDRAFVNTQEGVIGITVQNTLFNYPTYATTYYALGMKKDGSGLDPRNVGGRFGSLSVHPLIMPYLEFPMKKLWPALNREKRAMDKLAAVKVTKGAVVVTTATQPVDE